jgi:LuxR family transcriptional regulator
LGADGHIHPIGAPRISEQLFPSTAPIQTPRTRQNRKLDHLLEALSKIAPEGYSVGLHIRFTAPLIYKTTYTESWTKHYKENVFALRDPAVFWGLGTKGRTRWSEIKLPDPFDIFGQARDFGLRFGAVISHGPITSRTIVGIARADREFTDDEIEQAARITIALHDAAEPPRELTEAQAEALRLLSEGGRHAAAASKLGLSESALKARLKSARIRLGARTTAAAVRKAREYHFFNV